MNYLLKYSKHIYVPILLFIAFFVFLNVPYTKGSFEAELYDSRMESIVNDFDLNLVNNVQKGQEWIITKTDNYPDMHDWGAPYVWSMFYKVVKLSHLNFPDIVQRVTGQNFTIENLVIMLVNFLFFLLTMSVLSRIGKELEIDSHLNIILIMIISMGTISVLSLEFSSADMVASFLSAYVFLSVIRSTDRNSLLYYICLGFVMGFARFTKISYMLVLPSIFLYLYIHTRDIKLFFKKSIALIIGFSSIYILLQVNNFIMFGQIELNQGYGYAYSIDHIRNLNVYWKNFFGPGGIYFTTPILLVSFLLFGKLLIDLIRKKSLKKFEQAYTIFYFSVFAKLILGASAIIIGFQGYGLRQFSIEMYLFYFCIAYFLSMKNRAMTSIILLCALWALINFFWWESISGSAEIFNSYYIQTPSRIFGEVLNMLYRIWRGILHLPSYMIDGWAYFVIISFLYAIYRFLTPLLGKKTFTYYLGTLLFLSVLALTISNGIYNDKNSKEFLHQGGYLNKVVGAGENIFIVHEVLSTMVLGLEMEKIDQNYPNFVYRKKVLMDYLKKTKEEVLWDGIGYKDKIIFHSVYFPDNFYEEKSLDYKIPTQLILNKGQF